MKYVLTETFTQNGFIRVSSYFCTQHNKQNITKYKTNLSLYQESLVRREKGKKKINKIKDEHLNQWIQFSEKNDDMTNMKT